ncbi:Alpha/Beta hydrolase fold [Rhypophila sp. PSN 637]
MGKSTHQNVEFRTIDGVVLRGWLFPVEGPAPAIIMSHGFNCVKEMTLPDIAEWFHAHGYNVVLYDPRSVGTSEGLPRNQIDPLQMAEDLSDIVTHVSELECVDPRRVLLWGMSFGGMVSGCAAAVDSRPRAVIMVAPLFSFTKPERRRNTFAHLIRDRVSQLHGNEPLSLPPFNSRGENIAGFGGAGGPGGLEAYNLMRAATESGGGAVTSGFRDKITLQTFHKLALARPSELLDMVDPRTAVMMVVPELDDISDPAEQQAAFARLGTASNSKSSGPRKLHLAKGKGHLTIMTGDGSHELLEEMHAFFKDVLDR